MFDMHGAISLAWPTDVQLVVSFNSGLQGGLAKSTLSLFRHSDQSEFVFSLRCIDCVRKPLCEYFLCIFIKNNIGTQGEVCTVKCLKTRR